MDIFAGRVMSLDVSPLRAVSAHRHARFGALLAGQIVMPNMDFCSVL
jgi:hypothetical protein